jgi:hypothetical protein
MREPALSSLPPPYRFAVTYCTGSNYKARTHRQTLVVVAPSNVDINQSFSVFDSLIQAVNEARRNARDYFTELGSESDESKGETPRHLRKEEWVTSVNLGHLHPSYGLYTDVVMDAEPDAATKEYLARRMLARRSPYPSMVIEVRSTPPFDMPQGENKEFKSMQRRNHPREEQDPDGGAGPGADAVSMDDVKRLEALFGKGVALGGGDEGITIHDTQDEAQHKEFSVRVPAEDELWAKLAQSQEILEVSLLSSVDQAQQWVVDQDEDYCPEWSSFTSYDTQHVDAAYEFVFSTIAFHRNRANAAGATSASFSSSTTTTTSQPYQSGYTAWKAADADLVNVNANNDHDDAMLKLKRDYLLMPQFLSKAATSFEKFAAEVQQIVDVIPTVSDYLTVSTFHPEHVEKERRSPVPIMVLEWIPDHVVRV